jgi:hypothetical protein
LGPVAVGILQRSKPREVPIGDDVILAATSVVSAVSVWLKTQKGEANPTGNHDGAGDYRQ